MEQTITNCIYCDRRELTRTHVFPKNMGAKAKPLLACKRCNNMFSERIDAPAQQYVLRAFAVTALGEESEHDAFRNAEIRVPVFDADVVWQYDKSGSLTPKADIERGTGGYLSLRMAKNIIPKMIRGKVSDIERKQIEDFLEGREGREVTAGGLRLEKMIPDDLVTSIEVKGLTTNLDPRLLAKIVYEHAAVWKLHDHRALVAFRDEYLTEDAITRVELDPRLVKRTFAIGAIRAVADFGKLNYKPFFYVYLGLSAKQTVYALVGFYGVVKYIVSVGKCIAQNSRFDYLANCITLYFTDNSKIGVTARPSQLSGLSFDHFGVIADAMEFDATQPGLA